MNTKAIFHRKQPEFDLQECQIEKVIELTDSEYARFCQQMLADYDFLKEHADLMSAHDGVTHCILVTGETCDDGILVNSEGSSYARYAAFFPHAKSYLRVQTQGLAEEQNAAEQKRDSVDREISPALLAYGEKMDKIIDDALKEALENHDQAAYTFSTEELADYHDVEFFDSSLFIAMLKERPEIVDMDVQGEEIMVTLSLESIEAHDLSKLRVITQDDLNIMQAKHTLWVYDHGGEQADFTNCRLSGLDMSRMQLNGAIFTGALLENVDMSSAGVCSATFQNTRFVGCKMNGICAEEADFNGAAFEDCNIKQGHLAHSNFAHTQFHDTDLWMADMRHCCIEGTNIMDTETDGVNLTGTSEDEESWVNDPGIRIGGMGGM